ncbi:phosphotriesterase-related protein [Dyadobacter sp. BE34]|uniref:Phosphotriesterase-related protein n=1 Tax=Dyadobacter fermentans TaxID=94254 RepID=A0ABU1R6E7_9BACT|nr:MULTISPECIES: phosphotriesterase [Dyadobacter]MDR6808961.1 phosphotriesterase-related protein [Dyadobacter fermentans]MDR7046704.1 phosphotriesterase-related protein [Dyadobacter sp. BE242]MDR7201018.1 phosphotriesterase-related protein [Dyadobacter sp. BE34]MDR7218978.1 phosphotriesterase-related protein [Dyadobacter sp. BE31]MDR7264812.1 phosphotriesterase-related protein [Dyadobacter sp. BE32]
MANHISRRQFLTTLAATPIMASGDVAEQPYTYSVKGKIAASALGQSLIHEHVLVDFIGAEKISPDRWKHDEVIRKVLPYLLEIKQRGIQTLVECTPAFIGRDVVLLKKLSEQSGLNILTNTGYYGASDNKYLPKWAFTETAEQLASRWIAEFEDSIEGSGIHPGFIKTGVNSGALSELHQKLIRAAALTHLKTGLTICSHTGPALPAREAIEILKKSGVHPSAFVWVHASGSAEELENVGQSGCWISLDGVNAENISKHVNLLTFLKSKGRLAQVLISQDAGWYRPGEPDGGEFRGFTTISDKLVPALKANGFTEADIHTLMVANPAKAFAINVRKA